MDNIIPRLQALLTRWDEQATTAARKMERSKNPTIGGFFSGAMYGYEDCADDLLRGYWRSRRLLRGVPSPQSLLISPPMCNWTYKARQRLNLRTQTP